MRKLFVSYLIDKIENIKKLLGGSLKEPPYECNYLASFFEKISREGEWFREKERFGRYGLDYILREDRFKDLCQHHYEELYKKIWGDKKNINKPAQTVVPQDDDIICLNDVEDPWSIY